MLLLALMLLCLQQPQLSLGLIPTVCVANVTSKASVCCPIPKGFSQPCGGRGRGECVRIQAYQEFEHYHPGLVKDDRLMWPSRFFEFGCQCDSRYWGADCGECFFGWRGPRCNQRDVRLRRNIFTLSPAERDQYREISRLMRVKMSPYSVLIEKYNNQSDPLRSPVFVPATVHYWLVYVHRYASRRTLFPDAKQCQQFGILDLNHGGPGFMTWHRYYTMMLERELHKIAVERFNWTTFGLPYWDWVDATWCEVCQNDIVGAPGECDNFGQRLHPASPFSGWDEFCTTPSAKDRQQLGGGSCYGCHAAERFGKLVRQWTSLSLPTTAEVNYGLSIPRYYYPEEFNRPAQDLENCGFARYLEGHCGPMELYGKIGTLHNKVHNSVMGSFCCAATAPNDPIFFMHHSQISRLVHMWFLRHRPHPVDMANINVSPGHDRQSYMVGFYPPIRHEEVFTDIAALGYEYDTLEFGEPVRRRLQKEGRMPKPTLKHFINCQRGFLHPQHRLHRHEFEDELQRFLAEHPGAAA
ncbi:hypothetical protein BOX15_Mlig016084g1 [Macrostomum lignano]|uniref:Tyrosinase_Cu-bd domain-containing protein n=2 Tax=Macrostomum lignano TaxID=282301 RepID=A0A1I8J0F5_9PLAT|nr:hypothetical protein BOX15_Mlig016084g1 [Macrostomum lignano]